MGAHPVSCAVAIEVFKRLSSPDFLARIKANGEYLHAGLNGVQARFPEKVVEIRGRGLIAGAVLKEIKAADVVAAFRERGILVCVAGPEVVRYLPPLVIEKGHIDQAVGALEEILAKM